MLMGNGVLRAGIDSTLPLGERSCQYGCSSVLISRYGGREAVILPAEHSDGGLSARSRQHSSEWACARAQHLDAHEMQELHRRFWIGKCPKAE